MINLSIVFQQTLASLSEASITIGTRPEQRNTQNAQIHIPAVT